MMSQPKLEERLAALEKRVAELGLAVEKLQPKDWRSTIGMFAGDEGMKEVFEEARKIREKDRAKARKAYAKKKVQAPK
jgi:hypothetical protein